MTWHRARTLILAIEVGSENQETLSSSMYVIRSLALLMSPGEQPSSKLMRLRQPPTIRLSALGPSSEDLFPILSLWLVPPCGLRLGVEPAWIQPL